MGLFERYLSVWVGLAIVIGVTLGFLFPQQFAFIAAFEYANVNLLIAVLLLYFVYLMSSRRFVGEFLCTSRWY